jgi:Ser/Thr protein kinase RdoA (MazF antagonist)
VVAIERVRESTSVDWRTVGAMMRRVHTIAVDDIRGHHPLPMAGAFPWWQLDGLLDEVADLVDVAAHRGLVAAADRVRGWDVDLTDLVVCHGDVHPGNVLGGPDGPVLIDWDLLCAGPTAWDHAPLLTWATRWGGRPGTYEAFAAGYGWSASTDALAARLAEGRLVAATLLRLRAGRTDPSAAAEAQRRLSYWRGDADAPPWRAM